jgi:hypothetical protein
MKKQRQKRMPKKGKSKRQKRRQNPVNRKVVSMPRSKGSIMGTSNKFKEIRVRHKEFITDLVTVEADNWRKTVEVNPGLETCFPWMSRIAAGFENYVFNSIKFSFVTSMGTSNNGSIALIPDYDAEDDNSTQTKVQLLSYADSKRGPIWYDLAMASTKKNLQKRKEYYVRIRSTTENKKLFDAMSLTILVTGIAALTMVGELWVEYDLTLMTPQLEPEPVEDFIFTTVGNTVDEPFTNLTEIHNTIGAKVSGNTTLAIEEGSDYIIDTTAKTATVCNINDVPDVTTSILSKVNATITRLHEMSDDPMKRVAVSWLIRIAKGISQATPYILQWFGFTYGTSFNYLDWRMRSISTEEANAIESLAKIRSEKEQKERIKEELIKSLEKDSSSKL